MLKFIITRDLRLTLINLSFIAFKTAIMVTSIINAETDNQIALTGESRGASSKLNKE